MGFDERIRILMTEEQNALVAELRQKLFEVSAQLNAVLHDRNTDGLWGILTDVKWDCDYVMDHMLKLMKDNK